jgi:ferredoxin
LTSQENGGIPLDLKEAWLMAYKITDECISCGACEPECPNEAISEGDTIYEIDPEKCTECKGFHDSPKCAEICPVDACVPAG